MVKNRIQILDCTLRDGGYCNQWEFGKSNITKIINGLIAANVDIIECGFLTNQAVNNEDISKFCTLKEIENILPQKHTYVCMMNYGEYEIEELPECDGNSVDGIRIAFHKKDSAKALEVCKKVKEKKYDVYVQAMVSMAYSDEEFLDLIHQVNEVSPKAFYIVDSFGSMKPEDLSHFFSIVERSLNQDISIGFHCHNNMQLAYANAQRFSMFQTNHKLIVDSSVMGMGRGAGNLNTELFVEYLNENLRTRYVLQPLLSLIDEVLNSFYHKNYWGYSLPNYLSAKHNVHPNYAGYLVNKNTLTVADLDKIFSVIDQTKKVEFDKQYIEKLYLQYMDKDNLYEERITELKYRVREKTVLVIGPGRSSELEKEKILDYSIESDVIKISVNFDYPYVETDYIFLSNLRRFKEINKSKKSKMIVTSNIPTENVFAQVRYHSLKNEVESVQDNAGMMLIKLLITLGVKKIVLAGIDGYSYDESLNYAKTDMTFITQRKLVDEMNKGMQLLLNEYSKNIEIDFLTESRFNFKE